MMKNLNKMLTEITYFSILKGSLSLSYGQHYIQQENLKAFPLKSGNRQVSTLKIVV